MERIYLVDKAEGATARTPPLLTAIHRLKEHEPTVLWIEDINGDVKEVVQISMKEDSIDYTITKGGVSSTNRASTLEHLYKNINGLYDLGKVFFNINITGNDEKIEPAPYNNIPEAEENIEPERMPEQRIYLLKKRKVDTALDFVNTILTIQPGLIFTDKEEDYVVAEILQYIDEEVIEYILNNDKKGNKTGSIYGLYKDLEKDYDMKTLYVWPAKINPSEEELEKVESFADELEKAELAEANQTKVFLFDSHEEILIKHFIMCLKTKPKYIFNKLEINPVVEILENESGKLKIDKKLFNQISIFQSYTEFFHDIRQDEGHKNLYILVDNEKYFEVKPATKEAPANPPKQIILFPDGLMSSYKAFVDIIGNYRPTSIYVRNFPKGNEKSVAFNLDWNSQDIVITDSTGKRTPIGYTKYLFDLLQNFSRREALFIEVPDESKPSPVVPETATLTFEKGDIVQCHYNNFRGVITGFSITDGETFVNLLHPNTGEKCTTKLKHFPNPVFRSASPVYLQLIAKADDYQNEIYKSIWDINKKSKGYEEIEKWAKGKS